MTMLATLLALIVAIHPGRVPSPDERAFAEAAADVLEHARGPAGWSREKTAAVLVVTAYEESRFRHRARSRLGAVCPMQILPHGRWDSWVLQRSLSTCLERGLEALVESVRASRGYPLAQYAGGVRRQAARRISGRRLELAERLLNLRALP